MVKKLTNGGIARLISDAARRSRLAQSDSSLEVEVAGDAAPFKPRIFNILQYIEEPWGLAMKLYPVQKFLVKAYYHLPLDDREKTIELRDMFGERITYRFTEAEYMRYLYNEGRCNIRELDHPRNTLILPIGRRGGKTTLSGIFASYELYRLLNLGNPQDYYGLPNGNRIQITSVATDKEQAGLLFNEVTTHVVKCDYFKPYTANHTQGELRFRTPYDIEKYGASEHRQDGKFVSFNGKATLRVTFKSCVAKGLRGHGNLVVVLDEFGHFQPKGQSSAKDIWDSLTPSTAAFSPKVRDENGVPMPARRPDGTQYPIESRIICISSPLNRSGKFYELFHAAMAGGPEAYDYLAVQAPTWEVNPTVPSSYYRQKYHEDPTVFMTEHGAQFTDRRRGWIEREQDLLECVDPSLKPKSIGIPRYPHQMGIDIGLVNDATCVCITAEIGGRIELVYHEKWQAGIDWRLSNPHLGADFVTEYSRGLGSVSRLEFDEIATWIHLLTKRFHVTAGLFDGFVGIPLEQALLKKGLTQFRAEHFQRDLSSRIYQNTKMLMFDRRLVLYDYPLPEEDGSKKHSPHIDELLTLQAEQMSNNIIIVEAPQTAGFHDDFSDAYVRAVWLTSERMRETKFVYGPGLGQQGYGQHDAMTSRRYQMMRARSHGMTSDRPTLGMRARSYRGR